MAEAPWKKVKTYNLHPEWEEELIFSLVKEERHHNNNHQKFKDRYPPKSAICARNVDKLKSGLKAQQSLLTKPAAQNKAAAEASFHLSHLLVKHKKSQITQGSNGHYRRDFSASSRTKTTSSQAPWCTAWPCSGEKEDRASVRGRRSSSIKGLVTLNICHYSLMNPWM